VELELALIILSAFVLKIESPPGDSGRDETFSLFAAQLSLALIVVFTGKSFCAQSIALSLETLLSFLPGTIAVSRKETFYLSPAILRKLRLFC
jgi:hypothetical protein